MKIYFRSVFFEPLVLILGALFYSGQAFSEVYSQSDCYFRVIQLSETSFFYSAKGVSQEALVEMARAAVRMERGGSPHFHKELGYALEYAGINSQRGSKSRLLVTCGKGIQFTEVGRVDGTLDKQRPIIGTSWEEYFLTQGEINTEGDNKNAWILDLDKVVVPLRKAKSGEPPTLALDDSHLLRVNLPLYSYVRDRGIPDPLAHLFWFEEGKNSEGLRSYVAMKQTERQCLILWKSYILHLSSIQEYVLNDAHINGESEDLPGMLSYLKRINREEFSPLLRRPLSEDFKRKFQAILSYRMLQKCAHDMLLAQLQNFNSVQMDSSPCPAAQETSPSAKRSRPELELELMAPPSKRRKRSLTAP